MDIKDIRYFLMVAEERSFTRAAEKLFITQPALSRKVAELEAELGMPLLQRTGKRVHLTHQGELFCKQAQCLKRDYDDLILKMEALKQGEGLSVSIAYGMAGHIVYISKAIQYLKMYNPLLHIHTSRLFNAEIIERLRSGRVDAGVINLPELPDDLTLEHMTLLPCGLCAFIHQDHSITGVTLTSEGIKEAVNNAVAQAK